MPLVAASLLNAALGLVVSWASSRELRASPRSVERLRGFTALAAHELLLVAPAVFYLLVRHGDWMASYAIDASRVPSAFGVLLSVGQVLVALAAFSLGAHWIRTQRATLTVPVAIGCALMALVCVLLARERVLLVGTHMQFRAGFGMRSLWQSRLLTAVGLMGGVWLLAAAQLIYSLREGTPRAPRAMP